MAEEQYSRISRRMWRDEKFRKLSRPAPNAQDLWIHLLSSPRSTPLPGLLAVGPMGLAEDLDWPVDATRALLVELEDAGLLRIDLDARLLWMPNALRHNPPASANTVIGWAGFWRLLPECSLRDEAADKIRDALAALDALPGEGRGGGQLAVAFDVALGERRLDETKIKIGRPKKGPQKAGKKAPINGVEKGIKKGSESQDQDQEQKPDQDHDHPGGEAARGGGAAAEKPVGEEEPAPHHPRQDAWRESSESFRPLIMRLIDAGKQYAQKMLDKLNEKLILTDLERAALLRMEDELNAGKSDAEANLPADALSGSYAAGIVKASGTRWGGVAPKERANLSTIASQHARGPAGELLIGNSLKIWMRDTAAEFREATAATPQYQNGYQPSACLRWLDSGKPAGEASRPRAGVAAEKHAAHVQRGHADPGQATVGTRADLPARVEDIRP